MWRTVSAVFMVVTIFVASVQGVWSKDTENKGSNNSNLTLERQLVLDKEGRFIELLPDGTWRFHSIDNTGKIVFSVTDAANSFDVYEKKDEFGEIVAYRHKIGCDYKLKVENNTNYTVKFGVFVIDVIGMEHNVYDMSDSMYTGFISQSFDTIAPEHNMFSSGVRMADSFLADEPLTKDSPEIISLINQYGCNAQKGKIYLEFREILDSGWSIAVNSDSDITIPALKNLIEGSQDGVFPIQGDIRWRQ
jgi:hypothetical protein